jgi:hypothetical protein
VSTKNSNDLTFAWTSKKMPLTTPAFFLIPNFFLIPKLKMKIKGRRFQTLEEIQAEPQAVLNTLRENDFQECFKNWQHRWDRCQASEGDYFEGDAGPSCLR